MFLLAVLKPAQLLLLSMCNMLELSRLFDCLGDLINLSVPGGPEKLPD